MGKHWISEKNGTTNLAKNRQCDIAVTCCKQMVCGTSLRCSTKKRPYVDMFINDAMGLPGGRGLSEGREKVLRTAIDAANTIRLAFGKTDRNLRNAN